MRALCWFTRDLRVHDNPSLTAVAGADQLVCLYVVDPAWFQESQFQCRRLGSHRWRFLWQSLLALDGELRQLGQRLHIAYGPTPETVIRYCRAYNITHLVSSRLPGTDEERRWQAVESGLEGIRLQQINSLTLFDEMRLPFQLDELPDTFSQFRKQIEKNGIQPRQPTDRPIQLPAAPGLDEDDRDRVPKPDGYAGDPRWQGGEQAGLAQVQQYLFEDQHILVYKQTRNALDDWSASSKFSPWLSNGSLSACNLAAAITDFEQQHGQNESTYWLYFELLWREYFQWYAFQHGHRLFARDGVQRKQRPVSFYPQRFRAWCTGATPEPLINACMKQLRHTGYLSNRARQIVASYFVNDLGLDWRYGAAWFEEQLIDYDVGSNWGNWQYQAGVGADPRGLRKFNLEKQAKQFDPAGDFVARWRGDADTMPTDAVDAADWPIDH